MSETMETGPVLGEDARNAVASQLVLEYVDPDREPESWEREQADDAAHEVLDILAPHVAALVAEAERRGEARGAQAERERLEPLLAEECAWSRELRRLLNLERRTGEPL